MTTRPAYETKRFSFYFFNQDIWEIMSERGQTQWPLWLNDQDGTRLSDHGVYGISEEKTKSFFRDIENGELIVFAVLKTGASMQHLGNVSIQSIDMIHRSCEVAGFMGSRGGGAGKEGFIVACEHAFSRLNINRVYGGTVETNFPMNKIFNGLGFSPEGIERQARMIGGKFVDVRRYSILKSEWDPGHYRRAM